MLRPASFDIFATLLVWWWCKLLLVTQPVVTGQHRLIFRYVLRSPIGLSQVLKGIFGKGFNVHQPMLFSAEQIVLYLSKPLLKSAAYKRCSVDTVIWPVFTLNTMISAGLCKGSRSSNFPVFHSELEISSAVFYDIRMHLMTRAGHTMILFCSVVTGYSEKSRFYLLLLINTALLLYPAYFLWKFIFLKKSLMSQVQM